MILALFCIILPLLVIAYILSERKPTNFPPGPWGLPLIGHLHLLGWEPHKTVVVWKRKYGPIVGIDFASYPCVIISDTELGRAALANSALIARPNLYLSAARSGGTAEGVVFSSGRTWREQASFVRLHLRKLRSMEALINQQVDLLKDELRAQALASRPVSTSVRFNIALFNTLWALIAGRPFPVGDPILTRFTKECVEAFAEIDMFVALTMFMPWFGKYFPHWLTRADRLDAMFCNAAQMIQPYIDDHLATYVPGQPRDFIDAFLDESQGTNDRGSSFHPERVKQSLMATLLDLFTGGIETAGTTLSWVCLLLATHPDVQQRVAEEIQDVIGPKQAPLLEDRSRMPYTEAMIYEVMRFRTLAPLGAFHNTTDPIQVGGYLIPKDTMVYVNLWEANNNKEVWGDPDNFRPERWISEEDPTKLVGRRRLLSFGAGKRSCVGERLAHDELFLFSVGLLQEFQVVPDPKTPNPPLEPRLGASTYGPKPHNLLFISREEVYNRNSET